MRTRRKSVGNIVFVGGMHGVGKTSFSKFVCAKLPLLAASAGALIGAHEEKQVENVAKNQDVLIRAVESQLSPSKYYLMDGHFCLLNKQNEIERINAGVFKRLGLLAAVVLCENPAAVQKRLMERDGKEYPIVLLEDFQNAEIAHAQNVAESLNLPLRICENFQSEMPEISEFVGRFLP